MKSVFLVPRNVVHDVLATLAAMVCIAITRRVPPTATPSASSPRTSGSSAWSSGSSASIAWPWMSASCFCGGSVEGAFFAGAFFFLSRWTARPGGRLSPPAVPSSAETAALPAVRWSRISAAGPLPVLSPRAAGAATSPVVSPERSRPRATTTGRVCQCRGSPIGHTCLPLGASTARSDARERRTTAVRSDDRQRLRAGVLGVDVVDRRNPFARALPRW